MRLFGLHIKDLLRFFTERNKTNDGKIDDSSIMHQRKCGLLLPSHDGTVLLMVSLLGGGLKVTKVNS